MAAYGEVPREENIGLSQVPQVTRCNVSIIPGSQYSPIDYSCANVRGI